jgi:hypothetical protein
MTSNNKKNLLASSIQILTSNNKKEKNQLLASSIQILTSNNKKQKKKQPKTTDS